MSRRTLASLVAGLALLLAGWVAAPTAGAAPGASVTETGWWSRNPFAAPPDRGFQVATAPDGPVSVSAVRIAVEGRITKATLVLNEAGGIPEAASLRVCSGPSTWNATNHAWSAAPAADCSKTVAMTRNAAGANFAADVTSLVQSAVGSATLMVVPAPGAPAWQVDFSIAIVSAEAEPATTTTTAPATEPSSGGSDSAGGFASGGSSSGGFAGSTPSPPNAFDFGTSAPLLPEQPPEIGTDPSLDPAPAGEGDPGTDLAASVAPLPATGTSQPWGRLVVFLPLSILAGAAIAYGRRFALDRLAG